jgi:phage shock protein PspC (stress-responsive transcriptional regulator)
MFKGMRQVRLLRSATRKLQSGAPISTVTAGIAKYYETDQVFSNVLREFNATMEDVQAIILGLMAAGAGGTYRGHFVPVSAVLYPLTLSYLLRARRGEVPTAQAYGEIMEYFRSGPIMFEPEQAIRQARANTLRR